MTKMVEHTSTSFLLRRPMMAVGLVLSLAVVSGCSRDEEVLPGIRESLRGVLVDPDPVAESENQSAPISLASTSANASWPQFWGSPAVRTAHPALSATPSLIWSANIGQGNGRKQRITADPVVAESRVFTLDSSALVTATSTAGATLWTRDLTPPTDSADEATGGGLAYADGVIYVTLGFGSLNALDASDGSVIWSQDLEATSSGAPTVAGDLVYLTSGDDTGWAIERDSGRVRWQVGGAQSVSNILGAPSPVVTSDLAIFSFGSGDVQAVFRRGGLRRWDAAVVGERLGYASAKIGDITAAPVVQGNQLFVGNQSGRIVALNLGNGSRDWTAKDGAVGPIWPAGGSVFAVTDRNELIRLDAATGDRIWGVELPNFVKDRPRRRAAVFAHFGPILAGGHLLLAGSDGVLRSFDPTDGALLAQVDIPSGAATAPAIAGGTLYLVTENGQLLAYR